MHVTVRTALARWRLQAPLSRLVAVPDGDGAVLAGGIGTAGSSTNSVYYLNLRTGAMTARGAVPQAFHDAAAGVIDGRGLVFGGGVSASSAAVQSFTLSGPSSSTALGRLPQRRSDLSATSIGKQVFVLGGYTGLQELSSVLETSDGRSFRTVAHLPVTVRYAAVASLGSTIWVFGGEHGSSPVRAIQRVDTQTGNARVVGQLPTALSGATALAVNGRLIVVGGRDGSGHVRRTVQEFSPSTSTLRRVATLPVAVANAAGVVIADTAYLIGGEASAPLATVQSISVRTAAPGRPS